MEKKPNIRALVDELSISMLRFAVGRPLHGESTAAVPHVVENEALELIDFLLLRESMPIQIPQEVLFLVAEKVNLKIQESKTETRDCCFRILKALASRWGSSALGSRLFEIGLDLVLDPDQGIGLAAMREVFPKVSVAMLVWRETSSCPRNVSKPDSSNFSASDFASVMSLLSKKEIPDIEWHRLTSTIQARLEGPGEPAADNNSSNASLLLKTIRQAADWCVQNRLRTHFGGPKETFSSIEYLLKVHTTANATGMDNLDAQAFDASYDEGEKPSKSRVNHSRNLSKLMLLEFVSAFETYISNAAFSSDGDQSNPESESFKTQMFYRANKKVCEDWLSRIRPRLLEISGSQSHPGLSRHHAYAIVSGLVRKLTRVLMSHPSQVPVADFYRDVEHSVEELDNALFSLCRTYCEAKDADSINGFEVWRDSLSSTLASRMQVMSGSGGDAGEPWKLPIFPWLRATSLEAEMRYEDAATEYEAIMSDLLSCSPLEEVSRAGRVIEILETPMRSLGMSHQALLECIRQCANCYAAVRDWTKLRVFATKFVYAMSSIEEQKHAIGGCESLFDCCDAWKHELFLISALENVKTELPVSLCGSDAAAGLRLKSSVMQKWGILDEVDRRSITSPRSKQGTKDDYAQFREDLVRMSLQPNLSDPIAGEFIGKEIEQVLLRGGMHFIHDRNAAATSGLDGIAKVLGEKTELDHVSLDSASWSKAYFGLKSAHPTRAPVVDFQTNDALCQIVVEVAKLARKQRNVVLAEQLLNEATGLAFEQRQGVVMLEKSELLGSLGLHHEATSLLETLCESHIDSVSSGSYVNVDNIRLRSLLRLADGCDRNEPLDQEAVMISSTGLRELHLSSVGDWSGVNQRERTTGPEQILEMKGQYLAAATMCGPNSCEAWLGYSDWCYAKATREMERIGSRNGYIDLSPAEEACLERHLDALNFAKADRDAVVRSFLHLMENGTFIAHRNDSFRQLCLLRAPATVNSAAIDQMVLLQKECHSQAVHFHKLAAEGYGRYLAAIASGSGLSSGRSRMITVALRVLRLLTRFGAEDDVMSAIQGIFAQGPVFPWRQVVPQLLSRAAHPVARVSSLICTMLKRLAHDSPHLMVYPAVVDAQTRQSAHDCSSEHDTPGTLAGVLEELNSNSGRLASEVQLLVSELRRISILWDESWINTLAKLSADVSRRSSTLEKEAARVERNLSLSIEEKNELARRKFVAIMKPILVSIERLWEETCGKAGKQSSLTLHERSFLHQYGGLITNAVQQLRDACNADKLFDSSVGVPGPRFVWNPFAEILKSLQSSTGRSDGLPLQEISPAMASISKTHFAINMPGILFSQAGSASNPVSVQGIRSNVMVLRTKTKPKCLEFVGSDGKSYKYLLKAREDLRLDERVMQFLKTVNEFLKADGAASARDLSAQNYSVIPLSQDSGLIQMVPHVTPMFQVFTNWNEQSGSSRNVPVSSPPSKVLGGSSSSHAAQHQSPTAAFYSKLKQYGITDVSPNQRPHWPKSVLKHVYHDLVAQRPRNVLQQEISLGSGDLRESWSKAARLSKSLAVMSALGYIIGLGDRHLDNILLCKKSGDVLHIDYNVCFDKGLKLKVPEIVPFRLTPMLQDALGLTGVEGKFRVAFETTLRVVRASDARESLLTLLEAFVYDPLVDWTAEESRRGGSEDLKTRLEVNVNLSLFLSRAEERRHEATVFEHQMDAQLSELSCSIDAVAVEMSDIISGTAELCVLEQQEEKLSAEMTSLADKLSEYESLEGRNFPECSAVASRYEEIKAKLSGFANQCLSRHHQIEVWRDKSASFPSSQAIVSVLASTAHSSFSSLCGNLREAAGATRGLILPRELLASLQSKSQVVDAGVAHLRYSLELVMSSLQPWLTSYSHSRKDVDEFVLLETGSQENNIYWLWWKRCEEYLQLIENCNVDTARKLLGSSAHASPSLIANPEEIDESVRMVQALGKVEQALVLQSDSDNERVEADLQDQLQHIFAALSGMKLSNAQGHRLLKLAGATWIISAISSQQRGSFEEWTGSIGLRPPVLTDDALFRRLLGDAKSCIALLDLVMTPKGGMKKCRVVDILNEASLNQRQKDSASRTTKALGNFVQVLDAVQDVFVAVYDNFVLNVRRMQRKREEVQLCVSLLSERLESFGAAQVVSDVASGVADETSTEQAVAAVLEQNSGIRTVLRSMSVLLDQFRLLEESVPCVQGLSEREMSAWIELALTIGTLCAEEGLEVQSVSETSTRLFFSHAASFLRDHIVTPFEHILSDIISHEWKFGFDPAAEKTVLLESWSHFVTSQIPELFPSTLTLPVDPQSSFKSVEAAVVEFMSGSSTYCVQAWERSASEKWMLGIGHLYHYHRCRLWYSFWFTGQAPTSEYAGQMTQPQLLATLPAFAAELSRLSSEQGVLGSLVLEVAQQLEYVASQVAFSSTDANFHARVQACYSQVSSLFEYVRDLADLLQGISIAETSTGESGQHREMPTELEVDVIGRAMLHEGIEAAQRFSSVRSQMLEKSAVAERLREELNQKREALQLIADTKQSLKQKLRALCQEREEKIAATASEVAQRVKQVTVLLKAFDKFKASSRERGGNEEVVPTNVESNAPRNRRRKSGVAQKAASEAVQGQLSSFSFMENERLVRILSRNIKSADHLKALENVLDKHETNSFTLHGVVASIEHALRQYVLEIQPALRAQDSSIGDESAQSSFLAAAQRSASADIAKKSAESDDRSSASQLPRSYAMVKSLMALKRALDIEVTADAEQTGSNLLGIANKLVKVCFKLFFEATDIADRLSSLEKAPSEDSGEEEDEEGNALAGVHDDEDDFNVVLNGQVTSAGSTGRTEADSDGDHSNEEKSDAAYVQVKNHHAMQVLKRVEEKLCGQVMEHDQPRTLSVDEQASWLIESATKADNLCVMYEGWTPWI